MTRTTAATAAFTPVAVVMFGTACGASNTNASDRSSGTTTTTSAATSDSPAATDAGSADEKSVTSRRPASGGTPSAWPSGVPLPTAIDPGGASSPGSRVTAKDEESSAAQSGGNWSCDGMLADGRLKRIATSINEGRVTLDALVKRA